VDALEADEDEKRWEEQPEMIAKQRHSDTAAKDQGARGPDIAAES
jgi:hypothetical protein